MQIFDLFVIETPGDARECASAGIFDFTLFDMECENCSMALGPTTDAFIPVAIVSDATGMSWPVCIDCASSLIFPGAWFDR